MEYLANLVLIGIYIMLEIKFDEQIISNTQAIVSRILVHSFWQNTARLVFICGIIWNQPMPQNIIALHTFLLYTMFYWFVFDSIFASGVLNQKPWYLGTTSKIDRFFPKWSHFIVWNLKLVSLAYLIYFFIITY